MERERKSSIWQFFTRKEGFIATCNICSQDYSYRSSGNLIKHFRRRHCDLNLLQTEDFSNSDTSDGEHEKSSPTKKKKSTWHFYEVLDSDKFEATCKLCSTSVHYDSVSDLVKHIREEHGEEPMDSDEDYEPEVQETRPKRLVSKTWAYYKIVDSQAKIAKCLICRRNLAYGSTVTNLKRHLIRKHKEVLGLDETEDTKKMIISNNGQLFEVVTEMNKIDVDAEEKEPLEMDTIYLEDLEDSLDQIPPPRRVSTTPPKKKPIVPIKRNFSSISKEQVSNLRNTCSEKEQPKRRHSTEKMGTLDHFGQYIVSLLKELPKLVSDQLQGEIIKQIMTSKMALESQGPPNYKITISQNNCSEYKNTRQDIEPISVTINESVQISERNAEVNELNDGPKDLPIVNEDS